MTLHQAIIQVLQQKGRTMSTQEIADELNKNGLYSKKDDSSISDFQIHGRTRKYSHLFNRDGSKVTLKSNEISPAKPQNPSQQINKSTNQQKVPSVASVSQVADVAQVAQVAPSPSHPAVPERLALSEVEVSRRVAQVADVNLNNLMNPKNFKSAGSINNLIPTQPGLYCIRIDNANNLPKPFSTHLQNRNHNILYIGIATTSLRQRIGQELWAKGHGTFFRGLGAVLGYRPPAGSLINKKNKKNYTFSAADQADIIKWINAHLLINWVKFDGDFKNTEAMLIKEFLPLVNTTKNPAKLPELAALRKICRKIANA